MAKLGATPTTQLSTVAAQWQALDAYVAKKAYAGVFGYQKFPEFASDRINYGALVFQPIYGWDFHVVCVEVAPDGVDPGPGR